MGGIVVIPARGGSKRIPRKNLLPIGGRPMLEWPISTAKQLDDIDRIIVSTDDDEIAHLAKRLGVDSSRRRPDSLAQDNTPTAPVIVHEIEQHTQIAEAPDFTIVLYPTSIFIEVSVIQQMLRRLTETANPVQMVMCVTAFPAPIERAWKVNGADIGIPVDTSSRNIQSPDYEYSYYDNGQAYVSTGDAWSLISKNQPVATALHRLDASRSWDINTPDDLEIANLLFESRRRFV